MLQKESASAVFTLWLQLFSGSYSSDSGQRAKGTDLRGHRHVPGQHLETAVDRPGGVLRLDATHHHRLMLYATSYSLPLARVPFLHPKIRLGFSD